MCSMGGFRQWNKTLVVNANEVDIEVKLKQKSAFFQKEASSVKRLTMDPANRLYSIVYCVRHRGKIVVFLIKGVLPISLKLLCNGGLTSIRYTHH